MHRSSSALLLTRRWWSAQLLLLRGEFYCVWMCVVQVVHHWRRRRVVPIHSIAVFATNFIIFSLEMVPHRTSSSSLHVSFHLQQPGAVAEYWVFSVCLKKSTIAPPAAKMFHCCCTAFTALHTDSHSTAHIHVATTCLYNVWSIRIFIDRRNS